MFVVKSKVHATNLVYMFLLPEIKLGGQAGGFFFGLSQAICRRQDQTIKTSIIYCKTVSISGNIKYLLLAS